MPGQEPRRFIELPRCLPRGIAGATGAVGRWAWEGLAARGQFLAGLGGVFREESRLCRGKCRGNSHVAAENVPQFAGTILTLLPFHTSGQTNSISCFSDSRIKKNVKNAIKRVRVGDLYHMLVRMRCMRVAM